MKTKNSFATATMGDLRAEIDKLRKEVAANHERLGQGAAAEDAAIRKEVQDALDAYRVEYTEMVNSFRQGTRDFARVIDSRFNNVHNTHNRFALLVESRTLRGRWRGVRRAVARKCSAVEHFFWRLREAMRARR